MAYLTFVSTNQGVDRTMRWCTDLIAITCNMLEEGYNIRTLEEHQTTHTWPYGYEKQHLRP